jgi:hypothetical protein
MTSCHECPGLHEHILLEEEPRTISSADVPKVYWETGEYKGLIVAKARCVLCHTLYLAWVDWPSSHSGSHFLRRSGQRFVDLSYRRAFNDEPHPSDLPVFEVKQVIHYKRRPLQEHPYMDRQKSERLKDYLERWEATVNSGRTLSDDLAELDKRELIT